MDADNDKLAYSLDKTRDYKSFNINSTTGQLTTKAPLDYEKKSSYTVTVRATDPSAKSDTITVTIKVNNLNEFPTITGGDAAIFYPENGTAITSRRDLHGNGPRGRSCQPQEGVEVVVVGERQWQIHDQQQRRADLQRVAGLRCPSGRRPKRQQIPGNGDSHRQLGQQHIAGK